MIEGHRRVAWFTLIAAAVLVICAYARLIPYGHWQPDEFQNLVSYRTDPAHFFWRRLSTWSPRPFSEGLIYVYLRAVQTVREPLIPEALIVSWSLLFCAALGPLRRGGSFGSAGRYMLLGQRLSLVALFLLAHGVAELFYWPMAALAYLPTLGAVVFLHAVAEDDSENRPRIAGMIVLLIAATSTEVGAMYVVCHTAVVLASIAWDRSLVRRGRAAFDALIPLLVALIVLYRLAEGRVAENGENFGDPRYIHHALPSILAALPHALWEAVASDSLPIDVRLLVIGAGIKIAFFTGSCIVAGMRPVVADSWRMRLPVAIACFAMIPATLAAAYYQFGMMACCERHAALRQCLLLIGLASAASLAGMSPFVRKKVASLGRPGLLAAACFGVAIGIGMIASYPSLHEDYVSRRRMLEARQSTWQSGAAGADGMEVTQTAPGKIVGGYPLLPSATYTLADRPKPEIAAVLRFFQKTYGSVVDADDSAVLHVSE